MYRLSGKITDAARGQSIENVSVTIENPYIVLVSDPEGHFTARLKAGKYRIHLKHVGYDEMYLSLEMQGDTTIHIQLATAAHLLSESVVTNRKKAKGISGVLGGRIELNMEQLAALPKFIGVNDPLKILQLTPGVQTAGEGNSGIFIRGGEPGHNLILWNDAPIYNASHLLGSFSIFNIGHIGSFKLHKSNMGAEYGGRLSAVIAVESPEKIPEKISVSGDIGLITSQATVAIPMGRRSALYLSGRKTYVGLTLKPMLKTLLTDKSGDMPFDYEFQDCNLTFITRFSSRDKLVLNGYWGSDALDIGEPDYQLDGTMKWSNLATSLSWEHKGQKGSLLKNSFFMSHYRNKLFISQNGMSVRLPSSIRDLGYRNEFNFKAGAVLLKAGAEYTSHTINPQVPQVEVKTDISGNPAHPVYHTHDAALFLSGNFHLAATLSAEVGIRYAGAFQTGRFDDFRYNDRGEVIDSTQYGKGEKVAFYHGAEPRVVLRYAIASDAMVQLCYNRQQQFINLVSISGVGLPTDFWVPASKNIPPQSSHNFSVGYFRSFAANRYEFSAEGYCRWLEKQMEYNSALFDLFNQQYLLEQSISYGKGKAYGAEFMFKKNSGRFTGWISYTLGWSNRNFPSIGEGRTFPAKHDRRHDLSVVGTYKLNGKWDFSSVFVYATGNAFTMPTGIYSIGGNIVKEYGDYNGSRMPGYHRLDLSANYWFFKREGKESGLNFSVYNVYRRNNPLYVFIVAKQSEHQNNQMMVQKKKKKLYDIIPSVSWTFRF